MKFKYDDEVNSNSEFYGKCYGIVKDFDETDGEYLVLINLVSKMGRSSKEIWFKEEELEKIEGGVK